ncbi:cytochrome c biogenesis protein CcsA [Virgibacillus sp. YIM 98842]|uniref:cytochrome C assembly family protein n=1 Tax=Virgibacillus sp. YIM 98842 TaxID=2663533 RepID=UPI0013DD66E0|nr:cytochrome c biogenesis protein CcsA [Virgibacillus sp. YIM 98842]
MAEWKWLYEVMLVLYGSSLISYFYDFVWNNRKVKLIAFRLLSMVWVIQTLFLLYQVFMENNFPMLTLNASLFFYAWVLLTLSLIINRLFAIHFIIFFTNVFSFFVFLLYTLSIAGEMSQPEGAQFVHEILISHISLSILSYGFFTISFLFSLMYLIQYWLLKKKRAVRWIWRFGDLHQLEKYASRAVSIGVPILLIGIILGVVWAYVSQAEFYWFDIKTIGSILLLMVYSIFLIMRLGKGYRGKSIAVYNTAAFLFMLINFFLFSLMSGFHI